MVRELKKLLPKGYRHYVELFGGGAALLLALSPDGTSEILNDVNCDLINFYRVVQDPAAFARFVRIVQAIPVSRAEWEHARRRLAEVCADPVERAVRFFVLVRQSLAGRGDTFTGVTKSRTRGGRNAETNAWWNAVDGLPAVHERLKRVLVECRPAEELMAGHDVPGAVMYADPPYLPETRATVGEYGPHEMTAAEHGAFLAAANRVRHAKVLISGYPSEMYDRALRGWTRHAFE
jgi:DNA adenine methylase